MEKWAMGRCSFAGLTFGICATFGHVLAAQAPALYAQTVAATQAHMMAAKGARK